MFFNFDLMFGLVFFIVIAGFLIVFGSIIKKGIDDARQYRRNNASPVLTVDTKVVSKRTDVSVHRHIHSGAHTQSHTTSSTSYFVTFEFDSGDRTEFMVASSEYGLIAEGDIGKLTFQGTRYLGFKR